MKLHVCTLVVRNDNDPITATTVGSSQEEATAKMKEAVDNDEEWTRLVEGEHEQSMLSYTTAEFSPLVSDAIQSFFDDKDVDDDRNEQADWLENHCIEKIDEYRG